MNGVKSRRWMIGLSVVIGVLSASDGGAQSPRLDNELIPVAEEVYAYRHHAHQGLVVTTQGGILVADPISVDAVAWLKPTLERLVGLPVRYVVYSHDHDDHITGGRAFADQARFISHAAALEEIQRRADPTTPLPDLTFTDRLSVRLGELQVDLIYTGKNHSDNSLVLLIPQRKVLFAVDFIPVESVAYRTLPDAYPDEWIESLKRVEQLEFEVLVPGHGKIGTKDDVRKFRVYLETLRDAVREQIRRGATLEEATRQVRLPQYAQWHNYAEWFPENVAGMYRALSSKAQ